MIFIEFFPLSSLFFLPPELYVHSHFMNAPIFKSESTSVLFLIPFKCLMNDIFIMWWPEQSEILELSFATVRDNLFWFLGTCVSSWLTAMWSSRVTLPRLASQCVSGTAWRLAAWVRVSLVIPRSYQQQQKAPLRSIIFIRCLFSTT